MKSVHKIQQISCYACGDDNKNQYCVIEQKQKEDVEKEKYISIPIEAKACINSDAYKSHLVVILSVNQEITNNTNGQR